MGGTIQIHVNKINFNIHINISVMIKLMFCTMLLRFFTQMDVL